MGELKAIDYGYKAGGFKREPAQYLTTKALKRILTKTLSFKHILIIINLTNEEKQKIYNWNRYTIISYSGISFFR